jgi:UDP-glucose 4-epimerase
VVPAALPEEGGHVQVLVTGGSGFIGRHVVRQLLEGGIDVSVVDLVPFPSPDVPCLVGDLRDREVAERAVSKEVGAVVHLAAITSVLQSVNEPDNVFRTNVLATHYLLERCRELGVPRFVLASTNAVVGNVGTSVIDESAALRPLTPYGATKAAAEMLLSAYAASYGFAAVALRFTNVYGAGMQSKDSVVARMMRAAIGGGSVPVYGDGEQVRDYLYVSDAARALKFATTFPLGEFTVLTIGSGTSVSMNELYRLAGEVTGKPIGREHVPPKAGEMPAVIVNVQKAAAAGFVPEYDLRKGLAATWEDFSSRS